MTEVDTQQDTGGQKGAGRRGGLFSRPAVMMTLAVLLFLSVTVISDRYLRGARLDLTENGLYSLSGGTEQVLDGLEEPVRLTFYFSEGLASNYPGLLAYGKRVRDMLRAIRAEAPDKVTLDVVTPEPFSRAEDRAVAAGLNGVPLQDGSTLYLGLVARNTLDGEEVIPFFAQERERFLEYDVARMISGLQVRDAKQLTLISRLPLSTGHGGPQAMMNGQSAPYVIFERLTELFEVETLPDDFDAIPNATDVLMIAHPGAMETRQYKAIERYVLSGGKAIVMVDPHAESLGAGRPGDGVRGSDLGPLLDAWGVRLTDGKVVADRTFAQKVSMGGYGPDSVKDYLFWVAPTGDALDQSDVVTGPLDNVTFATVGALEAVDGAETRLQPLIRSSMNAALMDVDRAAGQPDPDALLRQFEGSGQRYTLAARLTGTAPSAYPEAGGDPPRSGDVNLAVIADSDMLDDRFWVQTQDYFGERVSVPVSGNGSFILNLAEQMAGSEALLGLRSRGVSKRPFEKVDALRRRAEARYLEREQALQEQLEATEQRIRALEQSRGETGEVFSPEAQAELDRFRDRLLETRQQLRAVKRSLRQDIERLGGRLAAINIALVPLLVVLAGLVRFWLRRRRVRQIRPS
ncbi:GldG family protein [Yunchengibacter salinarum]|uniref:GldG family protein n=1 Tax=Yunchengibacter salinarum TaxID=3133399 RepID=UPI0035B63E26